LQTADSARRQAFSTLQIKIHKNLSQKISAKCRNKFNFQKAGPDQEVNTVGWLLRCCSRLNNGRHDSSMREQWLMKWSRWRPSYNVTNRLILSLRSRHVQARCCGADYDARASRVFTTTIKRHLSQTQAEYSRLPNCM